MIKIFNKFFYYTKNILLPILMLGTVYVVLMMFQRLGKDPFGNNFIEFIEVIIPYILLIILLLVNTFLKQNEVRNSFFYNVTSFLAIVTIFVFCYRAFFDKNLILWHKLKYDIDFNYFTDQIAPMKTMLYLLSAANIMLMIKGRLKEDKDVEITNDNIKMKTKEENIEGEKEINEEDNFKVENDFEDKIKEEDSFKLEDDFDIEEEENLKNNFITETTDDDYSYFDDNSLEATKRYTFGLDEYNQTDSSDSENQTYSTDDNKNNNTNKNYHNNNKNKKNNYYKNNKNNNYHKKNNNYKQNKNNQNNNNNKNNGNQNNNNDVPKPKKTFDFYE